MNTSTPTIEKTCILGAGSSGLTVAKNFLQAGIPFDCLEREAELGGNWNYGKPASSIYASVNLISSKRLTEYVDFPMPREWPEFPSHQQVLEYLQNYAEHFELLPHITFNTSVHAIEPIPPGQSNGHHESASGWRVKLATGEVRTYRRVVIANGHNWDPKWPNFPGEFQGLSLHACQYKTPDVLKGKRVLVVGAGNSGCDLAVESSLHAANTYHSMRRGYYFLPKFYKGVPIDRVGEWALRWRLPLFLRRFLAKRVIQKAFGDFERVGLPKPDHELFETHPIINSQLIYHLQHGKIIPKPNILKLEGNEVFFEDGTHASLDVILYATGYNLRFPFIEERYLNWKQGRPELYLNIFHPDHDDLFFAGLIQPDSGQWGLVDYQAQLIAAFLRVSEQDRRRYTRFKGRIKAERPDLGHGIRYVDSTRHLLEVEHYRYRQLLQKRIAELSEP